MRSRWGTCAVGLGQALLSAAGWAEEVWGYRVRVVCLAGVESMGASLFLRILCETLV